MSAVTVRVLCVRYLRWTPVLQQPGLGQAQDRKLVLAMYWQSFVSFGGFIAGGRLILAYSSGVPNDPNLWFLQRIAFCKPVTQCTCCPGTFLVFWFVVGSLFIDFASLSCFHLSLFVYLSAVSVILYAVACPCYLICLKNKRRFWAL